VARTTTRNRDEPKTLEQLTQIVKDLSKQTTEQTEQEKVRDRVLESLTQLGSLSVQEDGIQYTGTAIILPAVMEGNLESAVSFIDQVREAEEETINFGRTFDYRPFDGAAAFQRAMQRVFGTTGVGKAIWTMFGKQLPQLISIPIGPGRNMQVPWGHVTFAPLECEFILRPFPSKKGMLFRCDVEAPRKYRRHIEGFLDVLQDELHNRSIYRGRAITAETDPGFLDPYKVDKTKVVYSKEALTQLNANVWAVLDHAGLLRDLGMPLKRAVLLEGQYGTGKTLTGSLTAQHAVEAGWTFILVRATDDPYAALTTAALYAPAVVWVEDLDVLAANKDRGELAKLLDALDGASGKGLEIMAGFTTNFPDAIDKAVLRPGRIDALIHIGALDPEGFEQLVRSQIPAELLDAKLDFKAIAAAFEGYVPAFAVEAAGRAIRYSVARNGGRPDVITTADLVDAAEGLRPQYVLQENASEAAHAKPTFEKLIAGTVRTTLREFEVEDVGRIVSMNGEE
jgi:hypothetical protein